MLSSSSVIKNSNVKSSGEKKITLDYKPKHNINDNENSTEDSNPYERLAENILQNAREKSEEIISAAYRDAVTIEKDAEEKGYLEGYEKGNRLGYEEGYNKALEEGKVQAEAIIEEVAEVLKQSKIQYESYLQEKSDNIKEMIVSIVWDILKTEVQDAQGIYNVIYETLKESRNTETFIIRCNSEYKDDIESTIEFWKQSLGFKGDIFVLPDSLMEKGKVIIDKDNGKVEIDIESSIEKVREIIMNS